MKKILFSLAVLATSLVSSQVLIDDTGNTEAEIHESAALQINSIDKGVVLPRMFDAPANPTEGLMYYDQLSKCFKGFDGQQWYELGGKCELPPLSVNEFHYRGSGVSEFVELRAPKDADVSLNKLILINSGTQYRESMISDMTRLSDDNYDYYVWETTLQDGENNGFALMNGEEIVELVSYRGTFTYQGQESTDVGVAQYNPDQSGTSIQFIDGLGWVKTEGFNTKGFANSNVAPPSISFLTSEVSVEEGAQGETTNVDIEISLDSPATEEITLNFDYTGTADENDYTALTSLLIPSGASSALLSLSINGNDDLQSDRTIVISMNDASGWASIDTSNDTFTLTINDDDSVVGNVLVDISENNIQNEYSNYFSTSGYAQWDSSNDGVRLGSSRDGGKLTYDTPTNVSGTIVVTLGVKGWDSDEKSGYIKVGSEVHQFNVSVDKNSPAAEIVSYTFNNVPNGSDISIETLDMNGNDRFIIYSIKIEKQD